MPRTVSRIALGSRGLDLTLITIAAPHPAAGAERRRVGEQGPVVAITANVHGDECTGVGTVLRLLPILDATLLRGTVHLYPTLNPEGLERRSRKVPEDDQDLNRLFPGDASGSPSERLAHAVWTDLCAHTPDLVIDIHTDAPASLPYALLDRATGLRHASRGAVEGSARTIATASGLTVLHEYPEERYARYRLDRSLTGAVLNRLQVPAVTIEAGPRLYLDTAAVDTATTAVLGMLHALGMVESPAPPHPSRVEGGPWRRDSGPRAASTGVLVPRIAPGTLLERGDLVAEIRALSGALLEEIHADDMGFVVSLAERTHVVAGVPVCTFALRE